MKRVLIAIAVAVLGSSLPAQEAKNVQLLKELTPLQLQRTMKDKIGDKEVYRLDATRRYSEIKRNVEPDEKLFAQPE